MTDTIEPQRYTCVGQCVRDSENGRYILYDHHLQVVNDLRVQLEIERQKLREWECRFNREGPDAIESPPEYMDTN